jgi:hypothetical protein
MRSLPNCFNLSAVVDEPDSLSSLDSPVLPRERHQSVCFEHRQPTNSSKTAPTSPCCCCRTHLFRKSSNVRRCNYDESAVPSVCLAAWTMRPLTPLPMRLYGTTPPPPTATRIVTRRTLWQSDAVRCDLIQCEFALACNTASAQPMITLRTSCCTRQRTHRCDRCCLD